MKEQDSLVTRTRGTWEASTIEAETYIYRQASSDRATHPGQPGAAPRIPPRVCDSAAGVDLGHQTGAGSWGDRGPEEH